MYTRVFESILDSSINIESVPTTVRWLWITMMLIADRNRTGVVDMPVERLAARAGMSVADTVAALAALSAPDPESTSDEEEGRRIVPIREDSSRGWRLVNWQKYRDIANAEHQRELTRKRVARHRRRNVDETVGNEELTQGNHPTPTPKAPATPPSYDGLCASAKQHRYRAGKVAEWWSEHGDRLHGMTLADKETAFRRDFPFGIVEWDEHEKVHGQGQSS